VAPFDSHGRAPFLLAGRRRGCRVSFLERTSRTKVEDNFGLGVRKLLTGGIRPFSQTANEVQAPRLLPYGFVGTPQFRLSPCTQRHPLLKSPMTKSAIWLLFCAPKGRQEFGTKKPVSAAPDGRRSVHSGTLQGATGGTQTHSRRTGSKLGRLQRARQGLVRVPESNTKYGG
jgi:hypothetical protein